MSTATRRLPSNAEREIARIEHERAPLDVRSAALIVIAALATVAALRYAEGMLIPIVLGVLISYALDPVVAFLARRGLPRPIAAALVLLLAVAGIGAIAYGVRDQVTTIIYELPETARRLRQSFERQPTGAGEAIEQVQKAAAELEKAAVAPPPAPAGVTRVQVEAPPLDIGSYVLSGSVNLLAAAGQAVVILLLSFFLLASGNLLRRKIVKIAGPSLEKKKITVQILDEIDQQIAWFLLVQLFTSTIVAVATWLAFLWFGVNQAAVWGIAAGVLNTIPYLGPVVVTGGTAVVALMQFGDYRTAVLIAFIALVITTLEGFLLTPWLTSRAARMNAVAIFVGLLFWGWVWNVWGMLLAVPMLMVIKAVCDHVEDYKAVGELLGD